MTTTSASADRGPAPPATAWRAMAGHPARFLRSSWPWRSLGYLLVSPLVAAGGLLAAGAALATGWFAGLPLYLPALPYLPAMLHVLLVVALFALVAIPLAAVERRRLRWVDPAPAPSPHRRPPRPGVWAWLATRIREAATWRELGYGVLFLGLLAWFDVAVAVVSLGALALLTLNAAGWLAVALGDQAGHLLGPISVDSPVAALLVLLLSLPLVPVPLYLVTATAAGRAAVTRALIASREEQLQGQVDQLQSARARIITSFDAERRRIERDLHDGAQQRLTSLVMTLGLAQLELDGAAEGAASQAGQLVAKAHAEAKATITELRELIHGIHPQALTDHGLAAAVELLAQRSHLPVTIDIDLPTRPPEDIEACCWFVVSEALANVTKHSHATHAEVRARQVGSLLVVEVRDDGVGGADLDKGTGLAGLADRVAVLDGAFRVTSPPGGPTMTRVELPCGS